MFGNRLIYNYGPGGRRRGLIYQGELSVPPVHDGASFDTYNGITIHRPTCFGLFTININEDGWRLYPYGYSQTQALFTNGLGLTSNVSFDDWFPVDAFTDYSIDFGGFKIKSEDFQVSNPYYKIVKRTVRHYDAMGYGSGSDFYPYLNNDFTRDLYVIYINPQYIKTVSASYGDYYVLDRQSGIQSLMQNYYNTNIILPSGNVYYYPFQIKIKQNGLTNGLLHPIHNCHTIVDNVVAHPGSYDTYSFPMRSEWEYDVSFDAGRFNDMYSSVMSGCFTFGTVSDDCLSFRFTYNGVRYIHSEAGTGNYFAQNANYNTPASHVFETNKPAYLDYNTASTIGNHAVSAIKTSATDFTTTYDNLGGMFPYSPFTHISYHWAKGYSARLSNWRWIQNGVVNNAHIREVAEWNSY